MFRQAVLLVRTLSRMGPKGIMKTFCAARDQKVQWKILSRQGPKGTMKHFIPPGTKGYIETFCAARDQKV